MPPKKAKPAASSVYIVNDAHGVDSVHASIDSANERATEAKDEGKPSVKIEVQQLIGGSIIVDEQKLAPKAKAAKNETEAPKTAPTKKTKPPAEQRAANATKDKPTADDDLPQNVKTLLAGSGDTFSGLTIVVTGVPPTLGRKNAEKLVEAYGGHLTKSLSKKTHFVVVGNDAGPTKLQKIEELGIETLDEDELIERIEGGGGGSKRKVEEDDEEEEDTKPSKSKKQKK